MWHLILRYGLQVFAPVDLPMAVLPIFCYNYVLEESIRVLWRRLNELCEQKARQHHLWYCVDRQGGHNAAFIDDYVSCSE